MDLGAVGHVADALLEAAAIAPVYPEDPRVGRPFPDAVSVFDGELRFAYCAVSNGAVCPETTDLPDTTKSDKRCPRSRSSTLLVDLVEEGALPSSRLSVNEVDVTTKGNDNRGDLWGFCGFYNRSVNG
jgi:hypothetical protein